MDCAFPSDIEFLLAGRKIESFGDVTITNSRYISQSLHHSSNSKIINLKNATLTLCPVHLELAAR